MMRVGLVLGTLALWVGFVACGGESEIGSPLSLSIEGPSTAVVGDTIAVSYSARGRSLVGLVVAWGDGMVDSVTAGGAQLADGRVRHAYQGAGQFRIIATIEDAIEGTEAEFVDVTVGGSQ